LSEKARVFAAIRLSSMQRIHRLLVHGFALPHHRRRFRRRCLGRHDWPPNVAGDWQGVCGRVVKAIGRVILAGF
jgi:hypothetical protein